MKKRVVAVIGLLDRQAKDLQQMCPDFELRYMDGKGKRTGRIPDAECAVVALKFTNHRFIEVAYETWPKERVVGCWGGLSKLKEAIYRLAGERK